MNYKEYKELKGNSKSSYVKGIDLKASELTIEEYKQLKQIIYEYEEKLSVTNESVLSFNDFEAFERNFEEMLDAYVTDEELNKIKAMMNSVGWKWVNPGTDAHSNSSSRMYLPEPDDMRRTIKELFDSCMNMGLPESTCSTGGFQVSVNLTNNHAVYIKFIADEWDINDWEHEDE